MTAFDVALAALARDPHMSLAGTYRPIAGGSVAVRLLLRRPDASLPSFDLRTTVPEITASIRVAELPAAIEGDALDVTALAVTYTVKGVSRDVDNLSWKLTLRVP